MQKTFITELIPTGTRKSYYGRAKIIQCGSKHYLRSYDTIIGVVDAENGSVRRFWNGRSKTTSSHIQSFLDQFADCEVKTVRDFYGLECEKAPAIRITL